MPNCCWLNFESVKFVFEYRLVEFKQIQQSVTFQKMQTTMKWDFDATMKLKNLMKARVRTSKFW